MIERSRRARRHRGTRRHRGAVRNVAALVPLTLVSSAWTVSLVSSPNAPGEDLGPLVAPTAPAEAFETPASVTTPARFSERRLAGSSRVVTAATVSGVPSVAMSAYQRAVRVIDAADPACHLGWPLLAAIGHVESDHGRHGDSVLRPNGISTPGIYGPRLDGSRGTMMVEDTDAGLYDRDQVFDRAVGPLQFIPTTWADVGVDADGDGKRNPQDIDDASLAAAVYLCAGPGDLSTEAGQIAALLRYNHSRSYVRLVRSLAAAYAAGDHTTASFAFPSTVRLSAHDDDRVAGSGARNGGGKVVRTPVAAEGRKPASGDPQPTKSKPPADPPAVPKPSGSPILVVLHDVTEAGEQTVMDTVGVVEGLAGGLLSPP